MMKCDYIPYHSWVLVIFVFAKLHIFKLDRKNEWEHKTEELYSVLKNNKCAFPFDTRHGFFNCHRYDKNKIWYWILNFREEKLYNVKKMRTSAFSNFYSKKSTKAPTPLKIEVSTIDNIKSVKSIRENQKFAVFVLTVKKRKKKDNDRRMKYRTENGIWLTQFRQIDANGSPTSKQMCE